MPKLLVFDPIDFYGGSKAATINLLNCLPAGLHIVVLTSHPDHWQRLSLRSSHHSYIRLRQNSLLKASETGVLFFVRHMFMALQILPLHIKFGRLIYLGASGSGVDYALYIARLLTKSRLVQLVHGPAARSRTIARALLSADHVFYLTSTRQSIITCLERVLSHPQAVENISGSKFRPMINGLPSHEWPQPCSYENFSIFWAASLLKWKGLSILLEALRLMKSPPETCICYIKPKGTGQETEEIPGNLQRVRLLEQPANLDQLRAEQSVFVSTSDNEPFGLSILEAMAAGLCPVIPRDGSWWDTQLVDGINCRKYNPNDIEDLRQCLEWLGQNPEQIKSIGQKAKIAALDYRAEQCYRPLASVLTSLLADE